MALRSGRSNAEIALTFNTCLHYLVHERSRETVRATRMLLASPRVDVNRRLKTVKHSVWSAERTRSLKKRLEYAVAVATGAESLKTQDRRSLLEKAVEMNMPDLVTLLLEQEDIVIEKPIGGCSILHNCVADHK